MKNESVVKVAGRILQVLAVSGMIVLIAGCMSAKKTSWISPELQKKDLQAAEKAEKPEMGIVADMKALVQRFNKAYKAKDLKGIMSTIADKPTVTAVTATKEYGVLVGPEEIRLAYEKDLALVGKVNSSKYTFLTVGSAGDVAWFTAKGEVSITLKNGKTMSINGDLSAVVEKIKGEWRFVQSHWSFPVDIKD